MYIYSGFMRGCLRPAYATFFMAVALTFLCSPAGPAGSVMQAQETPRKLKTGVPPEYPELAKRWNLKGLARVQLTVASNGTVQQVDELGGNPVLLDALVRAVKKWKYAPAGKQSQVEVKFVFAP